MATASISSGIVRQITPGLVRLQLRPRSTSHMTSTAACATFLWEPRASLCPLAARLRTPPKRVKRALPSVTNAASNGAGSLLSKEEVATRARDQFLHATRLSKPDPEIKLAKTCLTIALEEEAAAQVFVDKQRDKHAEVISISLESDLGCPSTWSLERLDMLANEAMAVFQEQLAAAGEEGMDDVQARVDALDPADRVELHQVLHLKPKPKRNIPLAEGQDAEAIKSPVMRVELFPLLVVNSINEVLYKRHGYRRSQRHGEPRECHITALLEGGEGSPVAMGILYTEICNRVGLPVAGMPIDDEFGQYYLLWPTKFPLKVGGTEFVIDPYGNGDLLHRQEVCEMFGLVDRPFQKAIRPASNREVLHALLSYMKNSYWARAVGCSPEPAFIEPLDSRTVTDMSWGMDWEEGNFNLKRALACAERQVHLMPSCQKTQLQYALLQYATGDYETAWQELGLYLERGGGSDTDDDLAVRLLMDRLRMYLEFDVTQRADAEELFNEGM